VTVRNPIRSSGLPVTAPETTSIVPQSGRDSSTRPTARQSAVNLSASIDTAETASAGRITVACSSNTDNSDSPPLDRAVRQRTTVPINLLRWRRLTVCCSECRLEYSSVPARPSVSLLSRTRRPDESPVAILSDDNSLTGGEEGATTGHTRTEPRVSKCFLRSRQNGDGTTLRAAGGSLPPVQPSVNRRDRTASRPSSVGAVVASVAVR
jgi:hypothetical protein